MTRVLVVYYSRTGTTERVADEIARRLGADSEALVDSTKRTGLAGYHHCAYEGWFQRLTKIAPLTHSLSRYDLVVVGTPIWCMSLSSPVRTFLRQHRHDLKRVAFFCSCGGLGGARVVRQMTREAGQEAAAVLVVREADVAREAVGYAIHLFARDLERLAGIDDGALPSTLP